MKNALDNPPQDLAIIPTIRLAPSAANTIASVMIMSTISRQSPPTCLTTLTLGRASE